MEKTTLKGKQAKGLILLGIVNKPICSQELLDTKKDLLKEQGFDTEKVNSINATLASLVSKDLVLKEKKLYKDKLLTFYSLTESGKTYLKENK